MISIARSSMPHERKRQSVNNTAQAVAILAVAVASLTCAVQAADRQPIVCDGQYRNHLQGITSNQKDTIYWSFTRDLVKTNMKGEVLKQVPVKYHHGDLCLAGGKVYVAFSPGYNSPGQPSKVYVYDADDLSPLGIKDVPEVTYGAGGMEYHKGHFFIIGGLPKDKQENYVYEYDKDFKYLRTYVLPTGYTSVGVQTICFHDGFWWLGCYTMEGKKGLVKTDEAFNIVGIYDTSPSVGIVGFGPGHFLFARHFGEKWHAKAVWARADETAGLVFE